MDDNFIPRLVYSLIIFKHQFLKVACLEFRETENQSMVAYYKQTRYRYLLSTWKKLSCMSKQMAKINQSRWLIIRLCSRWKRKTLANQHSCSIFWPIRARISLLTRSSDTGGRKVKFVEWSYLAGVCTEVLGKLGQWINFSVRNFCSICITISVKK